MKKQGWVPSCDCCGVTWRDREIKMTYSMHEAEQLCDFCAKLIASNLLRPEMVDGRRRYRQWHMGEWTPGELVGE